MYVVIFVRSNALVDHGSFSDINDAFDMAKKIAKERYVRNYSELAILDCDEDGSLDILEQSQIDDWIAEPDEDEEDEDDE